MGEGGWARIRFMWEARQWVGYSAQISGSVVLFFEIVESRHISGAATDKSSQYVSYDSERCVDWGFITQKSTYGGRLLALLRSPSRRLGLLGKCQWLGWVREVCRR